MTSGMEIGPGSQPLQIFEAWMAEAKADSRIREATAMAVGTVSESGEVHNRVVLCKGWSEEGFTFFTNYRSQKGQDLAANGKAGAVFYWDPQFKQIKISASVEKTSREVSENYWNSRARESQLSQYISRQSATVGSRADLERARQEADKKFHGGPVPCPEHWGGYLLRPKAIEFWVGMPNRLHDRHQFTKTGPTSWTYSRLYP